MPDSPEKQFALGGVLCAPAPEGISPRRRPLVQRDGPRYPVAGHAIVQLQADVADLKRSRDETNRQIQEVRSTVRRLESKTSRALEENKRQSSVLGEVKASLDTMAPSVAELVAEQQRATRERERLETERQQREKDQKQALERIEQRQEQRAGYVVPAVVAAVVAIGLGSANLLQADVPHDWLAAGLVLYFLAMIAGGRFLIHRGA